MRDSNLPRTLLLLIVHFKSPSTNFCSVRKIMKLACAFCTSFTRNLLSCSLKLNWRNFFGNSWHSSLNYGNFTLKLLEPSLKLTELFHKALEQSPEVCRTFSLNSLRKSFLTFKGFVSEIHGNLLWSSLNRPWGSGNYYPKFLKLLLEVLGTLSWTFLN